MPKLNNQQVATLLRQAGFPEEVVPTMVAIAHGESRLNPKAFNPDVSTGDQSYGLFQINMLGDMGPARRKQFGIASNEELYDPVKNVQAAKAIYDSQGLKAWGAYNNRSFQQFMPTPESITSTNEQPTKQGSDFLSDYAGDIIVNNYYGDGTETKQKQQKSFVDSLISSLLNQALNKRNSMDSILNEMTQQGSTSLNPLNFIA